MNRALLDTDIYSEILKGIDRKVVGVATAYRLHHGRLTISVVTVTEILSGLRRKGASRRITQFLTAIDVEELLIFDRQAAELAGMIQGDLLRAGLPIGRADPMIAAVAISNGLELVTGNQAHFSRIAALGYPLMLQNWR